MRSFIIFLLAFVCLFGASNDEIFKSFDNNFNSAPKTTQKNFHDSVKRVYIQSIINNDTALKMQALKRLIISSKALNLDSAAYSAELRLLEKNTPANSAKTQQKSVATQSNSSQNLASKPAQNLTQKTAQKTEKTLFLLSATKNQNTLVLKFSQNLDASKLKTSAILLNKTYHNILEIPGDINGNSQSYKNFISDEIRIVQFDPSTLRVTFSDSEQKKINVNIINNTLVISGQNLAQNSAKQAQSAQEAAKKQLEKVFEKKPQKTAKKESSYVAPVVQRLASFKAKTIVIDPGHGGDDPGAMSGKMKEKIVVLNVAKKLGEILKKRGYKVFYTRTTDKFINLRDRTKFANDKSADLFISIHANAAPNAKKAASMHGIETFFLSPARSERSKNAAALENKSDIEEMNYFSQQAFLNVLNREKIIASNKLGIDIQRELLAQARKIYAVTDGGVREAPFWVLVGALMPAVLVEVGYITHPKEGKMINSDSYQNALANGLANGIDEYFAKNR